MNPPTLSSRRERAFSLVELLVVLAIIAIVSSLALPVVGGAMRAYQLDSTGQLVVNQLNLARQTALSRGHAVQVRFYLLPDFNLAPSASPTVYRGMQVFVESDPVQSGTTVSVTTSALIKPTLFPAPIIISSVATPAPVSPLLPATATAADTAYSLPNYGSNYKYASFHFKPDGSTDLASGFESITLVLQRDSQVANGLPANFVTIRIDPLNGAIRTFRP